VFSPAVPIHARIKARYAGSRSYQRAGSTAAIGAPQNETRRLINQIFQSNLPALLDSTCTERMWYRRIVDVLTGGG
jgi:hypothetical protein